MMGGFDFPVEVVRTERRRSASIHLDGEVVEIRVPKNLSVDRIRKIITKRGAWIATRLKAASKRAPIKSKEYVSGESFPYLGRNYRLKVVAGDEPVVKLKGGYLEAKVAVGDAFRQETIRNLLVCWYKQHALTRLEAKAERFAKVIGVNPKSVKVAEFKSRWGSCSAAGDITYNWRIILAPHRVVDYVVVHELCHLLEHNHSNNYWKHVGRHAPNHQASRDWLKQYSGTFYQF